MAFTDKQIADYAHELSNKGASYDEIETFVRSAKEEQGAQATVQPEQKGFGQRFLENLNPATYYEKAFKPAVNTIGGATEMAVNPMGAASKLTAKGVLQSSPEFQAAPEDEQKAAMSTYAPTTTEQVGSGVTTLTEGTVKPIVKGAATASYGILAPMTGAFGESKTKDIDLYGLGNINPFTMSNKEIVGTAADTGLGYANIVAPYKTAVGAGVRGGAQAAAKEAQKVESTPMSIGVAGATGAVISAIMQGAINKISNAKKLTPKHEKELVKVGVKPDTIKKLKTMDADGRAAFKKYIKLAKEAADDPDEAFPPMNELSDEVTEGMRKLYALKKDTGKSIGGQKKLIKGGDVKVNIKPIKDGFINQLDDLGVTIDAKGNLQFDNSTIRDITGDKKLLEQAWKDLKVTNTLDDLVLFRDRLYKTLKYQRANQKVSGTADTFVKQATSKVRDEIHRVDPELAELDDMFTELTKVVGGFQKKTGGKVDMIVDDAIDGTNTFNLLRRSLSSANVENRKVVEKLQSMGDKYAIKELQNLILKRRLAQTAEDMVGIESLVRPTSFQGRVAEGGKAIVDAARGRWGSAAIEIKESLSRSPEQTELVMQYLQEPTQEGITYIMAQPAATIIKDNLKASVPQVTTGMVMDTMKSMLGMPVDDADFATEFSRKLYENPGFREYAARIIEQNPNADYKQVLTNYNPQQ